MKSQRKSSSVPNKENVVTPYAKSLKFRRCVKGIGWMGRWRVEGGGHAEGDAYKNLSLIHI